MASRFRISGGQLPSSLKVAPRYTNDDTCSKLCPFTIIDATTLAFADIITLVFAVLMISPNFWLASRTRSTNYCIDHLLR